MGQFPGDPGPARDIHQREDWTPDAFFGNRETWFTDVTGDGKADSIAVNGNAIFVRRSF